MSVSLPLSVNVNMRKDDEECTKKRILSMSKLELLDFLENRNEVGWFTGKEIPCTYKWWYFQFENTLKLVAGLKGLLADQLIYVIVQAATHDIKEVVPNLIQLRNKSFFTKQLVGYKHDALAATVLSPGLRNIFDIWTQKSSLKKEAGGKRREGIDVQEAVRKNRSEIYEIKDFALTFSFWSKMYPLEMKIATASLAQLPLEAQLKFYLCEIRQNYRPYPSWTPNSENIERNSKGFVFNTQSAQTTFDALDNHWRAAILEDSNLKKEMEAKKIQLDTLYERLATNSDTLYKLDQDRVPYFFAGRFAQNMNLLMQELLDCYCLHKQKPQLNVEHDLGGFDKWLEKDRPCFDIPFLRSQVTLGKIYTFSPLRKFLVHLKHPRKVESAVLNPSYCTEAQHVFEFYQQMYQI